MEARIDASWAFDAYEAVRGRLPSARPGSPSVRVRTLADLTGQFDVFLLDAFGVLNVGDTAISGAAERIDALRAAGKRVMVVTNAASYPKRLLMERYARLGFSFAETDVISSREVLLGALRTEPRRRWGVMAPAVYGDEELEDLDFEFLAEDAEAYERAEGFVLLGSGDWTEARQSLLEATLARAPRPVMVGNPDIVAPREFGLSREPGYFAHRLARIEGVAPVFFGKPFGRVFHTALARAPEAAPARVAMVGDTLHTDILGASALGLGSVLITGHGALKGEDIDAACARAGITPSFIAPDP
ncbi:HAD-IIA family hydrolase [Pikeienuella sp. HZG-20]|uniref:HAD-IIA family hydrolase n=1 Tax=Paludibacillus litoralis TaxID=3133267 RepID=UPI0030EE7383